MGMEMKSTMLGVALLLCMAGASAQMFKWVDEKGVIHYSDMPPPPSQKKVEVKTFNGGSSGFDLPYDLAEAVRNNPVTLYTTSQCEACDEGRAMLQARGVPFSEKTVNTSDDQKKLSEVGGASQLPLLLVGSNKLTGYEVTAWNNALSNATYPAQRMLPANYQFGRAEPAAPPKTPPPDVVARNAARAAAAEAAAEAARRPKTPPADAPPNFQF